jgi:hypothetical protein
MQNREYQHDDKDERHRGQQEIVGFDRQAGGIGADTIEHMPPIQMFRLRQRPKGMEYPACRRCNNGTGVSDLIASLLGRTYPGSIGDLEKAELKKNIAWCLDQRTN